MTHDVRTAVMRRYTPLNVFPVASPAPILITSLMVRQSGTGWYMPPHCIPLHRSTLKRITLQASFIIRAHPSAMRTSWPLSTRLGPKEGIRVHAFNFCVFIGRVVEAWTPLVSAQRQRCALGSCVRQRLYRVARGEGRAYRAATARRECPGDAARIPGDPPRLGVAGQGGGGGGDHGGVFPVERKRLNRRGRRGPRRRGEGPGLPRCGVDDARGLGS